MTEPQSTIRGEDLSESYREVSSVFVDLFDTLVEVDEQCLPKLRVGDKVRPSTAPLLYEVLRGRDPALPMTFETFLQRLVRNQELILTKKTRLDREISATTRFSELVRQLSLTKNPEEIEALGRHLAHVHTYWIARATRPVDRAHALLNRLRKSGRTVTLISNFDHAPAVGWILDQNDLGSYFDDIIISDEVGVRKPHADIFRAALSRNRCQPQQAFHIGDDPVADVLGAERLGIRSIWINRNRVEFPPGEVRPTAVVNELHELMKAFA